MKITFNELGVVTSTITDDESYRQGNVGNTLTAIFEGKNANEHIATIVYTRPDGSKIARLPLNLIGSDSYQYIFNDAWFMAISGIATLTIYLHDSKGNIVANGQVQFNIEKTDTTDITTITPDELSEWIAQLASKLDTNSTQYIRFYSTIKDSNYSELPVGTTFGVKETINTGLEEKIQFYQVNSRQGLNSLSAIRVQDFSRTTGGFSYNKTLYTGRFLATPNVINIPNGLYLGWRDDSVYYFIVNGKFYTTDVNLTSGSVSVVEDAVTKLTRLTNLLVDENMQVRGQIYKGMGTPTENEVVLTRGEINTQIVPVVKQYTDVKITTLRDESMNYTDEEITSAIAGLKDDSGKIRSDLLPSYVDDVVEYSNRNKFPTTGEKGKIYLDLNTNEIWRWSGSEYFEIKSGDYFLRADGEKLELDLEKLEKVTPTDIVADGNTIKLYHDSNEITGQENPVTFKTINGEPIIGNGDIEVSGGGSNVLKLSQELGNIAQIGDNLYVLNGITEEEVLSYETLIFNDVYFKKSYDNDVVYTALVYDEIQIPQILSVEDTSIRISRDLYYLTNYDNVSYSYNLDISPATAVVGTLTSEAVNSLNNKNATITRAGEVYRYSDKSDSEYLTYVHASIDTSQSDKPAVMRAIRINLTTYAWELLDYDLATRKELDQEIDNIINDNLIWQLSEPVTITGNGTVDSEALYRVALNPGETYTLFFDKENNVGSIGIRIDYVKGSETYGYNYLIGQTYKSTFWHFTAFNAEGYTAEIKIRLYNSNTSVDLVGTINKLQLFKGEAFCQEKSLKIEPTNNTIEPRHTTFLTDNVVIEGDLEVETTEAKKEHIFYFKNGTSPYNPSVNGINGLVIKEKLKVGETYTLVYDNVEVEGTYSTSYMTIGCSDENWKTIASVYRTPIHPRVPVTIKIPENTSILSFKWDVSGTAGVNKRIKYNGVKIYKGTVAPYILNEDVAIHDESYKDYGLPILYLSGNTYAMTKDTEVTLDYVYGDLSGTCTCKWQGSSSLSYPKKNYTIKFDNAFEAKTGWGNQTKYCMKANYIDFTHARNIVNARLWGEIVKSRSSVPTGLFSAPNYGAVDGFPIGIVINGAYTGLYTMNIPKDKWLFGMGSGTQQAIICAEGVSKRSGFRDGEPILGTDFEVEYATDENNTAWIQTALNNIYNAVQNATAENFKETVGQYVDIDSIIDYLCLSLLINNSDGIFKNYLLATYDGTKWFMSAYDMDATYSLHWNGSNFDNNASSVVNLIYNNQLLYYAWNMLRSDVVARYNQLRNSVMADFKVMRDFWNFGALIPKGLLDKEVKLWTKIPSTSANNINQIILWYITNAKRVDDEMTN